MRRQELHPRTAIINKSQKNVSRKARKEALDWLIEKFPKAFDTSCSIQPLKIGILEDILAYADEAASHGISKSKLREAVVVFTRRIDYLASLKAQEMRIDLQGKHSSEVTEEEALVASSKIKKRVEKSARNARKALGGKTPDHYLVKNKDVSYQSPSEQHEQSPHYFEKAPLYASAAANQTTKPTPAVIVRHKAPRQFDPEAVARLKEKLGLSKQVEEINE